MRKSTENRLIVILFAVSFGAMTPLGIALGWIFDTIFNGYIADFFVCAAAGTFIYVAIIEVLVPEFGDFDDRFIDLKRKSQYSKDKKQVMRYGSIDNNNNNISENRQSNMSSKTGIIAQKLRIDSNINRMMKKKHEMSETTQLCLKMGCVCLGFGLMSLLAAWV